MPGRTEAKAPARDRSRGPGSSFAAILPIAEARDAAGHVVTIEPGIYFIPQLMDQWRAEGHCQEFIDFDELNRWRDFGGVRNEEDYLITGDGGRRLGRAKPKTIEEIEALRAG